MSVKRPTDPVSGGDPSLPPAVSPSVRRARNPHGQGGKLRAELIAAADHILAQTGNFEALSLRGVAREVGIATPSIYLHFPDKRALIRAVLEVRFEQLRVAVQEAALAATGPDQQLRAGCRAYCQFATENPNAYRVLFGRAPVGSTQSASLLAGAERGSSEADIPSPYRAGDDGAGSNEGAASPVAAFPPDATGVDAFMFLVDGASRCMRAGLAPPGDPMRVAIGIWTALHGIVTLRASLPEFPWPPLQQQIDDVLSGLVGLRHNSMSGGATTPE
jgi:AcrR family transcriptional regulator